MVLVDEIRHRVFAYNASAARVWMERAEGHAPRRIAIDISRDFGVPVEQVARQIRNVTDSWRSNGLLPPPRLAKRAKSSKARSLAAAALPRDWSIQPEPSWAAQWTCKIRELTFRIAVQPPRLVSVVRILLRHLEVRGAKPDFDLAIRATGPNEAALVENGIERMRATHSGAFKDGVHRAILERLNPGIEWFALLHAGALARNDVGIVFPAESGSGKTTLLAYLMAQGYEYFADDLVALAAPDGAILPWPLPLSVKSGSWKLLEPLHRGLAHAYQFPTKGDQARLLLPPSGSYAKAPVLLRYLVFPDFSSSAETSLREIGPLDTLERLLRGRVWLGHPLRRQRVEMFLGWLTKTRSFALTFSHLASAAQQLQSLHSASRVP